MRGRAGTSDGLAGNTTLIADFPIRDDTENSLTSAAFGSVSILRDVDLIYLGTSGYYVGARIIGTSASHCLLVRISDSFERQYSKLAHSLHCSDKTHPLVRQLAS